LVDFLPKVVHIMFVFDIVEVTSQERKAMSTGSGEAFSKPID